MKGKPRLPCIRCGKPVDSNARGRPYFCTEGCAAMFAREAARQGFRKVGPIIALKAPPNERTDDSLAKFLG